MKKIITCLCLSVFCCIIILKPISIYAYTDLNTYIEPDLSVEDAKEYVAQTILAYALAAGAEMVVPGSGATVATITDKVWDAIDFTDELYSWALQAKRKMQDGYLPWSDVTYNMDPGSASYNSPILLAWDNLRINWDNDSEDVTFPPDYSFLNDSKDFVLVSNNSSGSTTWIADNHGWSYRYDQSDYPYAMNKSDYTYVAYPNNTGNFFSGVNGFYLYDITTFYVTLDSINNKYIVTASGYNSKGFKPPNRNGAYTNWYGFYFDNRRLYANNFSSNTRALRYPLEFNTLNDALVDICKYYRHFNLYVDNQPWILVNHQDPIQIGGNTYITNTNTPVYYDFPDGTLFDPNAFAAIMRQLIDLNNTGNAITIQLDDVLESFTDEYGVTAQYVVNVVRNDYDNLISEQYGNYALTNIKGINYPKDQIQPYTSTMAYVTEESTDLIPDDILIVLASTGVLILFAFLINRMLE